MGHNIDNNKWKLEKYFGLAFVAAGDVHNMDECMGIILVSSGSYSEFDQWTGYTETRQQQLLIMLRNTQTNMVQITHAFS